jgi:hypothetical protein
MKGGEGRGETTYSYDGNSSADSFYWTEQMKGHIKLDMAMQ